jgi:hypothetical protein
MALCMSAAIVACSGDDDDNNTAPPAGTPSDVGQSCTRTADCKTDLVCIDQVCEKKGGMSNAGAPNEGSGGSTGGTSAQGGTGGHAGGAGTGGSTPAPVLGGEGESCTRAADCQVGLHCFNQRCTKSESNAAGGEGGMGSGEPPTPKLGERGETCVISSDCVEGLLCLPATGQGNIGVCTLANSGIVPTGKDCHAECVADTDCCQLPPALLTNTLKSCADLDDTLTGVDCTSPTFAELCFIQASYCNCAASTWKCTDGLCSYAAACQNDGLTSDGCATYSRSNKLLPSTCTSGHCAPPTCKKASDCDGMSVADDPSDTCTASECTCFTDTGGCYRKCSGDLDCAAGMVCDTKTSLCGPAHCSDALTCQGLLRNVNAVCIDGTCEAGCEDDLDCSSNLIGSLTAVCNSEHYCEAIGCSDDVQCSSGTSPNVHMFCTEALTGTERPSSAVTDGK